MKHSRYVSEVCSVGSRLIYDFDFVATAELASSSIAPDGSSVRKGALTNKYVKLLGTLFSCINPLIQLRVLILILVNICKQTLGSPTRPEPKRLPYKTGHGCCGLLIFEISVEPVVEHQKI